MTRKNLANTLRNALDAEIASRNELIAELNAILPPFGEMSLKQRAKMLADAFLSLNGCVSREVDADAVSAKFGEAINQADAIEEWLEGNAVSPGKVWNAPAPAKEPS